MKRIESLRFVAKLAVPLLLVVTTGGAQTPPAPRFSTAAAFDVSPPLSDLARQAPRRVAQLSQEPFEIRPERGPVAKDKGFS